MSDMAKARDLIETIRYLAPILTEDEISDIGKVLLKATDRLLKEARETIE